MKHLLQCISLALISGFIFQDCVNAQTLAWMSEHTLGFGYSSRGIAADPLGNVYVNGFSSLNSPKGVTLSRFDASGSYQWTQYFGGPNDQSHASAADAFGNAYITGNTSINLEGSNAGGKDVFLGKFAPDGTQVWMKQFGTDSNDGGQGVTVDHQGNLFLTGYTLGDLDGTNDGLPGVFLRKYDTDGNLLWSTMHDGFSSHDVSCDGLGNIYIAGNAYLNPVGMEPLVEGAFVSKFDEAGALQWTQHFGTEALDWAGGVSADSLGNVFVTGFTQGALEGSNQGAHDLFVTLYDSSGDLQWVRQVGSSLPDIGYDAQIDGKGNVYISGHSSEQYDGEIFGGGGGILMKYDSTGQRIWTRKPREHGSEFSEGVSIDAEGNIYVGGASGTKVFAAKFIDRMFSADFDGDDEVSEQDLAIWLASYGKNYNADADFDGDTDGSDFLLWQAQLGSMSTSDIASSESVPEPNSFLLGLLSCLTIILACSFNSRLSRKRTASKFRSASKSTIRFCETGY